MSIRDRFWETIPLQQMNAEEWEALCDGCGKCCLHKLQDEETDQVYYTRVACRLLDARSCRCSDYAHRRQRVEECLILAPETLMQADWLPSSCAYRLLDCGENLPQWHYLVSGDRNTVHRAGASVRGRTVPADFVHSDGMEEHIIDWVD